MNIVNSRTLRGSLQQKNKKLAVLHSPRTPQLHEFVVRRMDTHDNDHHDIPHTITLLQPDHNNASTEQLFIDHIPVPRDAWSYDTHDKILRWRGLFGGGQLHLHGTGRGAVGMIGDGLHAVSVTAGARAQFLCSVALNCGAAYVTQGGSVVGFNWDTNSAEWKNAQWIAQRLKLSYTVTQSSPIMPPTFTFEFEDKQTAAIPWDPSLGQFSANLSLGEQGSQMVWNLVFKSSIPPAQDKGLHPATGPDTVYPYWLQAVEDAAASVINGVMEIDNVAPKGTLVGIQGARCLPMVAGYYQVGRDNMPFSIFHGKIHVNGAPVAKVHAEENALTWTDLAPEQQKMLGLPASGTLLFSANGSSATLQDQPTVVKRLTTSHLLQQLDTHKAAHPALHGALLTQNSALTDSSLNILGLLNMSPFAKNAQGEWGDVVQANVRQDLSDIMNSFVPSNIWSLLFPNTPQPTLSGELAIVANSPVKNVPDPTAWYKSLGTAVMTQGMSGGSDKNCANMNGPRAGSWLKDQVANSPVYQAHGQLLFQNQWLQLNSLTTEYLQDQIGNAPTYQGVIDTQTQSSINDIKANVIANPDSPPDMVSKLIGQVTEAGQYAKTNKLYWAFAYYTYNTAPAILANIAIQISINTGNGDGTTLSRLFQQNITVLTALDPSGYFAQMYNQTINTFMSTNLLPSLYGFTGDVSNFNLIKEYLEQFVKQNINSEDKQIAQAAAQLQDILAQKDADEMLKASIEALRAFSAAIQDAMSLPFVANQWLSWFTNKYPNWAAAGNIFGSILIGGVTGLAFFNLILAYKDWSKLSGGEKAEIILNTIQLGTQILAAVVKRGVRIYAIFDVEGMTFAQRTGALSRIMMTGEASRLNEGLLEISNSTARWLGDTAGAAEMREDIAMLMNIGENDLEQVAWTTRVFGRNLDEFMATRLGPVLILAAIGLSIYFISTGESGVALASDIVNIVGSALMLFSMVGGWLIEGGIIASTGVMATIISVAGPLAIVAALVGVALMLYEMFKKQPDPIEQFVNDYVRPAGFYVGSKCSSIDYVFPYANSSQNNLLIMGFSLGSSNKTLVCGGNGNIGLQDKADAQPDTVWQVQTDGLGLSQIVTIAQSQTQTSPVGLLLSLMSDNTVSFQPKMSSSSKPTGNAPTVLTQTWLSTPTNSAQTTNNNTALVSLNLTLQPVLPDSKGNYQPTNTHGWLQQTASGVTCNATSGTTFTLQMSAMAPNFMRMSNLNFMQGTIPSQIQVFGPQFGITPSTPITFVLTGTLPEFLTFNTANGTLSPNGKQASQKVTSSFSLKASNPVGSHQADFTISVAPIAS